MRKRIAAALIAALGTLGLGTAASASTAAPAQPAHVANESGPVYLQINSHRNVGLQTHNAGQATLWFTPTKLRIEESTLGGHVVYRFHADYDNSLCLYGNTSSFGVALAACQKTHLGQWWLVEETSPGSGVFLFRNYASIEHGTQFLSSLGDQAHDLVVTYAPHEGVYREWHVAPANSKHANLSAFFSSWPPRPQHHGTAQVDRAACTGSMQGRPSSKYDWATSWIVSNGCWQRASEECKNPLNGDTAWYHGAWRLYLNRVSGDNCPALSEQVRGGFDYGHQAGSPYSYHQMWSNIKTTAHLTAHHIGIKIVKPGPDKRNPACGATVVIFLTNSNPQSFAQGTGTGNPLVVGANTPPSEWNVTCPPNSPGVKFHPTTNTGNCIEEANTSHDSTVIDNPCDSSIARQVWMFFNQDYQGDWFNNWDGAVVYTYGTGGDKLRFTTGSPCGGQSGCWWNWAFYNA